MCQVGELANDQQKNLMASFKFDIPAISAGTTFVFGSWVYTADGSGDFSSHFFDTTSMKTLRQEQLGETTSAEILLPQLAEEIEKILLKTLSWDCSLVRLLSGLRYDFDSDLLNFPSLTIMATPLLTVIKCQIRPTNRLIIKENYTLY